MSNPLRRFAANAPRLTAMAVLALFALAFAAPTLIYGPVDLSDPSGLIDLDYLSYALRPQFAFASSVVLITIVIGWARPTLFVSRVDRHGAWIAFWIGAGLLVLFGSIAAVVLTQGVGTGYGRTIAIIVALNLLVGLFEEVLFRGIVFHGLRARHSLTFAVVVSSVLFGVFHLTNLSVGQSMAITTFQVINATAIGLFLCAIMLQANSLWPAILLHAIWNCYAMTGQLLLTSVPIEDMAPPAGPTAQSFILPVIITLAAGLLFYRWRIRMDRTTPPPIPQDQ